MRLVEVKVLEPESAEDWGQERALDSMFNHPARWRYINSWLNTDGTVQMVGGEGRFPFDEDGHCENFVGLGEAWINQELDEKEYKAADRFLSADSYQTRPGLAPALIHAAFFDGLICRDKDRREMVDPVRIRALQQDRAIALLSED